MRRKGNEVIREHRVKESEGGRFEEKKGKGSVAKKRRWVRIMKGEERKEGKAREICRRERRGKRERK
jgi:hypothetical protein